VVGFRLIGVAPRELAQRLIDPIGAPHVPGDHRGATGPSGALGEKLTHHSGVISKRGHVVSWLADEGITAAVSPWGGRRDRMAIKSAPWQTITEPKKGNAITPGKRLKSSNEGQRQLTRKT
jgi:hypothetical protein